MGAKGALGGGGLIALAAGAPPTWTVNASNTENKSNNTSAKMLLLCWRHYQLQVKRHFWGADLAALTRQQTTRQQTETTAPARLQSATAESAVAGCRRGTTQTTWLESDCLLTLTCWLTHLLTYLLDSLLNVNDYLLDSLLDSLLTDCVDDITSFKSSDTSGVRVISIITTFHEIAWFFKKLFFKKKCNFHRIIDWKMIYFSIFCFSTDLFFDLFSYFFHWFREN